MALQRSPFPPSDGPGAPGGATGTGRGSESAAADWEAFSLLSDDPVLRNDQDELGATRTAERLSGLLLSSFRSTPFTLAIDAGWGMGKSSLMRLVEARLREQPQVRTVWYNAWTAAGGDALEGLIKSVLVGLDPNVLRRGLRRLRDNRPLAGALRALATAVAGLLHAAGPINELWDRMSADARARNEMRDVLRGLVTDWSQGTPGDTGGRMLVVFVDDLDRCSQETVLAVCEALKLYLDVPGLAFVIGCDRSALAPGGLLRDLSPAGSAFLEKIFQTSYRVPAADDREITRYVTACAQSAGIDAYLDDDLTRLLVERTGRNPRRVKRLVNGFVLEATLNAAWRGFGPRAVLRVLLLQYFYADFYRMLTTPRASSERDTLTEFRDYRLLRRFVTLLPDAAGPPPEDHDRIDAQLRYHSLATAPGAALDAALLHRLERDLPDDFPRLAADRGFTSLLDELLALEEADDLFARLQFVPAPVRIPDAGGIGVLERAFDLDVRQDPARYAGMHVLWVDDNVAGIERAGAAFLRNGGADVLVVGDEEAADSAIGARTPDVIISDIVRGRNRTAGFDYVDRLRADEVSYTGPVVFFTSEVTRERRDRAAAAGALRATVRFEDVLDDLDGVMAALPRARTVPQARPSDGRPR